MQVQSNGHKHGPRQGVACTETTLLETADSSLPSSMFGGKKLKDLTEEDWESADACGLCASMQLDPICAQDIRNYAASLVAMHGGRERQQHMLLQSHRFRGMTVAFRDFSNSCCAQASWTRAPAMKPYLQRKRQAIRTVATESVALSSGIPAFGTQSSRNWAITIPLVCMPWERSPK